VVAVEAVVVLLLQMVALVALVVDKLTAHQVRVLAHQDKDLVVVQ
jgi:hypothetical protein